MWLWLLACAGPRSEPGPTVVWISLDTVRADHLRLYGGRVAMPALEAFAARSAVFTHAYSHFPQTQQSHWVALTSTLPEPHRYAADNMDSAYKGPTLAEHLQGQGWKTGAFVGGITMRAETSGLQRGFDVYDDDYDFGLDRDLRPAPEVRAAAQRWLSAQAGPRFGFVHFFDAHTPYTPRNPSRYDADYRGTADGSLESIRREWASPWMSERDVAHVVALYDAELTELDEELGRFLDTLPADAIVVISSDHGESFEHGYLFNHPEAVDDSVLHVPLIIHAPGQVPARFDEQVGLIDVVPTLLSLAGVAPLPEAMGAVLLPHPEAQVPLYARCRAPPSGSARLAVRTPSAKAVFEDAGASWAYDLAADPHEDHRLPVPEALAGGRAGYEARVAPLTQRYPARLDPPRPDPALRDRLEALGYAQPAPQGPPLRAP